MLPIDLIPRLEIILHPLTLAPVQRNDPRYGEIYLLLQDHHVSEQRTLLEKHRKVADNELYLWNYQTSALTTPEKNI